MEGSLRAKGGERVLEEGEEMGKTTIKTRRNCSGKRERTRTGGLNDLKRLLQTSAHRLI